MDIGAKLSRAKPEPGVILQLRVEQGLVIPAKTRIQDFLLLIDTCFRRHDAQSDGYGVPSSPAQLKDYGQVR